MAHENIVAVNVCPHCNHRMPDRTTDDYRLAAHGMYGDSEICGVASGTSFWEDCPNCNEFLIGIEYMPRITIDETTGTISQEKLIEWHGVINHKDEKGKPVSG